MTCIYHREMVSVIRTLGPGDSAGTDNLPPEFFKFDYKSSANLFFPFIGQASTYPSDGTKVWSLSSQKRRLAGLQ